MSYRNKTYVIFDGDNDMRYYNLMLGWKKNKNMDFNFHDAHDLNTITDSSGKENTKRKLRIRLSNTKQAVVLIGDSTKYLYPFVRWEIEVCRRLEIPIVAVNLNGRRSYDEEFCPAILRDAGAIHVSYNARIIKYALDDFCANYDQFKDQEKYWEYDDEVYDDLGL